jgi:hypothetical protein
MSEDKVHREKIIDQPSMTSVVTSEYFFMPGSDVAIHINSFKFIVAFTIIATSVLWAIGLWTNWYWLLAYRFAMLFWDNWWLGPSVVGVIALGIYAIYINRPHKKKGVRKSEKQTQQKVQ